MVKSSTIKGTTRDSKAKFVSRSLRAILLLVVIISAMMFALTDSSPITDARPAPTAEQVGAGRDALLQLRTPRSTANGDSEISFSVRHLDGLSALATHGFRPDRVSLFVSGSFFHMSVSHKLTFGRWLNFTVKAPSSADGFPAMRVRVSSISLSPYFSRLLIETLRSGLLANGADIPPLDTLIRQLSISDNRLVATVKLPNILGGLDKLLRMHSNLDAELVTEAYCRLAIAQELDPQNDFALQVRRAFPLNETSNATPQSNSAALVALAMAVVDKKAGSLAGVSSSQTSACDMPASRITLHGREDLAKHWAVSAALAVGPGVQIAEAIGEWKELADSLSRVSEFQLGDPTGFSFVDIAADRSGFRIAEAASGKASARKMAMRLSSAVDDQILPRELLLLEEGSMFDFGKEYGGLEDPRYAKNLRYIDMLLAQKSLLAP